MSGAASPEDRDSAAQHVLREAAAAYRARGYTVTAGHHEGMPDALLGAHPDLVATRGDERVAVVVRTGRQMPRVLPDVETVRSAGWRLELFAGTGSSHPGATPEMVAGQLREAAQLSSDHKVAALLLEWAAAEEVLRMLTARFAPEEATGRAVPDHVYSLGLLSEGQHQLLDSLLAMRDQVAHAVAPVAIPDASVQDAATLLDRMLHPSYVPPPIMADRAMAAGHDGDALDQVRRAFPEADPADQEDAAEYLRELAGR